MRNLNLYEKGNAADEGEGLAELWLRGDRREGASEHMALKQGRRGQVICNCWNCDDLRYLFKIHSTL